MLCLIYFAHEPASCGNPRTRSCSLIATERRSKAFGPVRFRKRSWPGTFAHREMNSRKPRRSQKSRSKLMTMEKPCGAGARLLFVVLAPEPGKNYRLAKMATPAQAAYFRHARFSLFGKLNPDETIAKIPPLEAPPPVPPAQGSL